MMKRLRIYTLLLSLLCSLSLHADEGMWVIGNLNKPTRQAMKELGLKLSPNELYHPKKASLKDAVVSFGGFCSGVVVSDEGLVLTNHHCGFNSVREHSSVDHDYLQDGFVAHTRSEELPNPELYVRFLLRTEDVTGRVLSAVSPAMSEHDRVVAIDSVSRRLEDEVSRKDSTLVGVVEAFYAGNEFRLSVYQDFNDVRLVYAPPSSVGKFGWDTDNWMWPRHTGDFCVFRIYADRHNRPADYAPDNVPYHPRYVVPLSTTGYQEGDFCMTIGYPGSTERYLSSFGIEELMNTTNQAQIDIRTVKESIWKEAMNTNDTIRIKYASKYDESSNYRKNSLGMNLAIRKLHIIEKKQAAEAEMREWIRRTPAERTQLLHLFTDLELNYKKRRAAQRAQAYFVEAFLYAAELPQLTLRQLNLDVKGDPKAVAEEVKNIREEYANLDVNLDKKVFAAMLDAYRQQVDRTDLPDFYYLNIDSLYGGSARTYIDTLYAQTRLTGTYYLDNLVSPDTLVASRAMHELVEDPAVSMLIELLTTMYDINLRMEEPTAEVIKGERTLNAAIRRMYAARNFYPDANSTMRLSFGTVASYTPFDGARYDYYTTPKGILEKNRAHADDPDFYLQPALRTLLASDAARDLHVCFITNNDITGGNSGSAMFNARGELLGLAFDGNWEAMSSDIQYDAARQRCIGVDIRYILFIMGQYGKADGLVKEMMKGGR